MKHIFPIFLILFCLPLGEASAQIRISGQILDAGTGIALPAATVQVRGTTKGAITNDDGRFVITIERIPAVLFVRHIGYQTATQVVESSNPAPFRIELHPSPVFLDEVVVSGEDPALDIMRRVIQQKAAWRSLYSSSYAEVYTRFWLFREFDPIQVHESVRSEFWKRGQGNREIVQARRMRPADIGTFRFAGPEYVPNFYDDSVSIRGTSYATPTHPDALAIYRFRLGGRRSIDDQVVWDIYFTPRSGRRSAFTGHVAVLDSAYSILEIDARLEPPTLVTPPVQTFDVRYQQHFVELEGGIMVPVDMQTKGSVTFGRLGASYPPARFEQISSVSNYSLDAPVPDSLFSDEQTHRLHPMVDHSDFLFIRNPTIVPLTPREIESIAFLDPRMTIERAFRPDGLLRQYTAIDVTEDEPGAEERTGGWVGDLLRNSWVWYNRVDGWHPGLQYRISGRSGLALEARLGYASDLKKVSAGMELSAPIPGKVVGASLFVAAEDQTRPIAISGSYSPFVTGFMTYMGYDDYSDYFRNRSGSFGIRLRPEAFPVKLDLQASHGEHRSVSKESDFNGWWFRNVQRSNPEIVDGIITSVSSDIKIGSEKTFLSARLEKAMPDVLNSDFDFTKLTGEASFETSTFLRNRDRPNTLRVSFRGSTFSGNLPRQLSSLVDGSTGFYSSPTSFRTFSERPLVGSKLASVFWEHDFTTSVMEILGLWRLASQGWGVTLFGAHAKIFEAGSTSEEFHELGLGIKYPFRLPVRINFSARLNDRQFSITLGRIQI